LGNIKETTLQALVNSEQQRRFGHNKYDRLPKYCKECPVLFACYGECPRNRFTKTPDGEPGLNYLCAGYKEFFRHIDQPMKTMAGLIRQGRFADEIMPLNAAHVFAHGAPAVKAGRNDPCPCGSGMKYKRCHGLKDGIFTPSRTVE
jgi:uncharacterized protein